MKPKVSVIVPVYNGERFVNGCCAQLVCQTLKGMEIIFIDDGSTDQSGALIDNCAEQYENVFALHQANMGVSAARNNGIAHASGVYIGFVDVDDEVDPDMFEALFEYADEEQLDVVCMDAIGDAGEKTVFSDQRQWMSALFRADIRISACNKLFRRDLLQGKGFPEGKRIHEDLWAVYQALSAAESVGAIYLNKYHYIHRENSSSQARIFTEKYFDAVEIADWIYADAVRRFPDLQELAEARRAKTYLRITKIFYLRGAPVNHQKRILEMRRYLKSLPKRRLSTYFVRNDVIRYCLYLYTRPLFLLLLKTIDRN